MKPGLKVIVFFYKKILFVTVYFIFQIRTLRIQYFQFGIKMFTSSTQVPWLKLGAGHDHQTQARLHYDITVRLIDTTLI